jgi:hypothetical protein
MRQALSMPGTLEENILIRSFAQRAYNLTKEMAEILYHILNDSWNNQDLESDARAPHNGAVTLPLNLYP